MEDGSSGADIKYIGSNNNFVIATGTGGAGSQTQRLSIQRDTGDISFYDDTGSTQGLFWDASAERLGLGTTSPSGTLHVKNSTGSSLVLDATITGSSLTSLAFQRSSTNKWRILQQSNDSHLLFYNDVNGINQLSLKADGNVGIGETSPDGKLHIKGGTATGDASHVLFENTQGSKVFAIGGGASGVTNNNLYIRNVTDNTTPMVITDAGNVGVGTNSPARNLHVHASNFTDLHLTNDTTGATASDGTSFTAIGSDIYLTNREAGNMVFQTSGTERARIDSGGRLGIGTTSPSLKLHSKDTGNYQLDLDSGGTRWRMGAGWSGYYQNSFLLADTANGIRMAIDTSGKVGIGTALPSDKLHVVGDVRFTGQLKMFDNQLIKMGDGEDFAIYHDTTVGNVIKSSTSDMDIVIQGNDGGSTITALTLDMSVGGQLKAAPLGVSTPTYAFTNDTNTGMTRPTGDTLQFVTAGQERVRINSSGYVGINMSNPSTPLDVAGIIKITESSNTAFYGGNYVRVFSDQSYGFRNSGGTTKAQISMNGNSYFNGGNIGIGTASPAHKLTVAGGNFVLDNAYGVFFGDANTGISGRGSADTESYVAWRTNGSERARIDSSGNLLVGTASTVVGSATSGKGFRVDGANGIVQAAASGVVSAIFNRTSSDGDIVSLRKNGTQVGSIGTNSGYIRIGTGDTHLLYHSGIDTIIPYSGSANRDAAISLGYSGARFKDLHLSGTAYSSGLQVATSGNLTAKLESTSGTPKLQFLSGSGTVSSFIQGGVGGSANLLFATNDTERARIDSSGNLLVGKTSSSTGVAGARFSANGFANVTRDGGECINFNRLTSDGTIIDFRKDSTTQGNIGTTGVANGVEIYIASGNTSSVGAGLSFANVTISNYIAPCRGDGSYADNLIDLGTSSARFDDIYATNGTIQTSDRNEKQDIQALTDAEQRVATACKGLIRRFRWQDAVEEKGDDARLHFGVIAQDLQDAFTAEGLDAGDYGMFISSTWTDDDGNEQTRLGVRYNELLAFIITTL